MGLTGDAGYEEQFLGVLGLEGLSQPFRTMLRTVGGDPSPRQFAIAATLSLLKAGGFELHTLMLAMNYLSQRSDDQLGSDMIFLHNGAIIGFPSGDKAVLLDLGSMREIPNDEVPPRVQLTVWYTGVFMEVARDVLVGAESDA